MVTDVPFPAPTSENESRLGVSLQGLECFGLACRHSVCHLHIFLGLPTGMVPPCGGFLIPAEPPCLSGY